MDTVLLSSWAQIAASIAVLVTLVYLSIEIKQTKALLHSESRQTLLENDRERILAFISHADLMEKLTQEDELSYQDQWRYSCLWILDMRNREHEYFQYRAGVLDKSAWLAYREIILLSMGTERDRYWWKKRGRNIFDPEFVEMVDALIKEAPYNSLRKDLGSWQNELMAG